MDPARPGARESLGNSPLVDIGRGSNGTKSMDARSQTQTAHVVACCCYTPTLNHAAIDQEADVSASTRKHDPVTSAIGLRPKTEFIGRSLGFSHRAKLAEAEQAIAGTAACQAGEEWHDSMVQQDGVQPQWETEQISPMTMRTMRSRFPTLICMTALC